MALFATDNINSISIYAIRGFFRLLLGRTHQFASINFLNPPWGGNPPLLQLVFEPGEIPKYSSDEINDLLGKSSKSLLSLGTHEKIELSNYIDNSLGHCPRIAAFPEPFKKYYSYENQVLNIEHPGVELFFRILSKILLSTRQNQFKPDTLGHLHDIARRAIRGCPDRFHSSKKIYSAWIKSLQGLGEIATRVGICSEDITALIPDFSEIVPNSLEFQGIKLKYETKVTKEFGQIL
ncbi:hypothetical protein ES707_14050 [subsurface metagenome]